MGLEKRLFYFVSKIYAHRNSWDSSVSVATELWTGQSAFGLPAGARDFSLLWNIQSGSGAHPAFYSVGMGGGGSFFGDTAAGAWHWQLTSSAEGTDGWSCTCADYIPTWCRLGKLYLNLLYRYRCKSNWHQCGHHGVVLCFSISITPRSMTWLRKRQPVWPKAWLASLCQYWRQRCRSCRDMTREAWLDPSLVLRYAFWQQKPFI